MAQQGNNLIVCTACGKEKAKEEYDAMRLLQWNKERHVSRDAKCLACWIPTPEPQEQTRVKCVNCKRWLEVHAFLPETLQAATVKDQFYNISCQVCSALTVKALHWCRGCKKKKPLSFFSMKINQRAITPLRLPLFGK